MSDVTTTDPQAPAEPETGARLGVVIGALMLSLLLAALDSTIVATALPTIVGELGGLDQYAWVVTSYLLTFTVSTPLYGKLGDLYGRKRLFQAAIVIFLVGSALSGLSQNMGQLIAFRGLQGLGGGGLMVGSQAIIGDIVSPRERGRYQGYFGAVFGFASVAGPLVGGFLTDNVDWRWVFYVNLPIGLVALVAVATALKAPVERVAHSIDYLGTVLMAAGVTCLILVTTWGGNEYDWASPTIVGLAVAAVALLGLFVWVEARVPEPLMPLRLFRNSTFTVVCVVALAVGGALYGATTYLPQYQQVVRGQSATSSGLQLIPLMAGVVVASLLAGQLISRTGRYKIFPLAGTATMAVGLFMLSNLGVDTGAVELGLYMALLGVGIGLVMQMLVLVAQNSVDVRDLGTATSTASFARSIGGSFGVALFGSIFNSAFASNQAAAGIAAFTGDPTQLSRLPEATRAPYLQAYADALDTVFLAGVPLAVGAFIVACFLREVPLRSGAVAGDRIAGASNSFGLAPLSAAGVMEEITVRVRAARAALAQVDELAPTHPMSAAQLDGLRWLFQDRIAYLTEATGRVEQQADDPPERWKLLVDLLRIERTTLAATISSAPATALSNLGLPAGGPPGRVRPTPVTPPSPLPTPSPAATPGSAASPTPGDVAGAGASPSGDGAAGDAAPPTSGAAATPGGGVAGARWEAEARVAAAEAALDRLNELEAAGDVTTDNAAALRELFDGRVAHVRERAESGIAVAGEMSPAGWALVLDVLAAERRELAAYEACGDADAATTQRATRHLDTETSLVTP